MAGTAIQEQLDGDRAAAEDSVNQSRDDWSRRTAFPDCPEPYIQLPPSAVMGENRIRAVGRRIYTRPKDETFHEFLIGLIRVTLGEEWWRQQSASDEGTRHTIVRWAERWNSFSEQHSTTEQLGSDGTTLSSETPGSLWSLVMLGYDFFCLLSRLRLPDHLLQRFRRNSDFHAARYEATAAAVMLRSGFDIDFLDETESSQKHCELIATHRIEKLSLGVEAKVRRRPGILHHDSNAAEGPDWRAVENLVRKARRQKPEGLPFVIFVDINLPPAPDASDLDKPWIEDLRGALDHLDPVTPTTPEAFNALFVTNFAYYYDSIVPENSPAEFGTVVPNWARDPLPEGVVDLFRLALSHYDRVPPEL